MPTPLRVLIVEDSEDDVELLLRELRRAGYDPSHERVQTAAAMRAALDQGLWDLVISDYSMPDFNGTQALALLRERGLDTPFIFVSGTIGEEVAVAAMRSGAQDYVLKGNLKRLAPAIARELHDAKLRRERERAQEALRATEERLHHVIASSGAVIYELQIAEGASTLHWISDNLTRILGYTVAEALAPQWWLQHVHPDDREWLRPAGASLPAQDRVVEYRFRHKDGTYRWIRDEQRVAQNEPGAAVELVGAWLDITRTKQLEEQFRQAQKMEAVGRLAGGIAHDFNNLLTAITGYAELLRQDVAEDNPQRADLDEIIKAARRAATLTQQLLAFSRQQVLQPRVLDLNEVVAGMDNMLRRIIGEDIDLLTVLEPQLGRVRADPGQLEQVIVNLAVNSRDAMPGGGKLTIETANTQLGESPPGAPAVSPGSYVLVAVSDTGTGMDEKTKALIFEPFFTTKEPGKGTGLGLATVYGIVQQSGGHIVVYSEPGRGTTFKIYLPSVEEAAEQLAPKETSEDVPGGSETILLVEDEDGVRKLARQVLERRGYRLLEASNADEALVICHRHAGPIHLLVTDIVMPGVSGAEAADELRRIKPGMKVLYMSGYPDRAVTHHRILDPDLPFLQKPFAPDTLARKVHEALEGR